MLILEKCLQELEDSDLFQVAKWKGTVTSQDVELIVVQHSNAICRQLFDNLNLSLLSGEYLQDLVETDNIINQIKALIGTLPSRLDQIADPDIKGASQFFSFFSFQAPLLRSLRNYHQLVYDIKNKTLHNVVLFKGWWKENQQVRIAEEADSKQLADIFDRHIKVSRIDHTLSVDSKQLRELIIIQRELEEFFTISTSYKQIIADKADFLARKINYRFKEDQKNYTYAFEFDDALVDAAQAELKFFKPFLEKTKDHYNIDILAHKKDWRAVYERTIKDPIDTFYEFHLVLHFYKDKVCDLSRMRNLKAQFDDNCAKMLKSGRSPYEIDTINTDKNYFINSEFSVFLNDEKVPFKEASECLQKIITLQNETGIRNYFPYLKFCYFLIKKIESKILDFHEHEDELRDYLSALVIALKDAFKAFEWCKDSRFLSFQLPIKESTLSHDLNGTTVSLFLASSFVLPINYVKIERDLKDIEKKIDSFKAISDVHKSITHEKSEIKKMRAEVEKMDRRSIEIIGIFAAIVLFASGSIQIFSIEGITPEDGLRWMLMFSYSLILFIFLIWLITREGVGIQNLKLVHWIFLGALTISWVLAFYYVFVVHSLTPISTVIPQSVRDWF